MRLPKLLRLAPVHDLGPVLQQRLPCLTAPQRAALLERGGGHPGFVAQIIAALENTPGLFEGRDPKRPLTPAGLAEILREAVSLSAIVRRRFQGIDLPTRTTLAIGSLQGPRFLEALVAELCERFGDWDAAASEAGLAREVAQALAARSDLAVHSARV